jgi:hypothetical protein
MAKTTQKSKPARIVVTGDLKTQGDVSGKGSLTFIISDASKASVLVDAKRNGTNVTLASSVGLKIRKSATLDLSGSISKDLNRGGLDGDVGVKMKLPKGINVSVAHRFRPDDDRTSVKLTIRF